MALRNGRTVSCLSDTNSSWKSTDFQVNETYLKEHHITNESETKQC